MTGSGKTKKAQAALTDKAIKAMKPDPASAYRVPDIGCKGLALRVAPDGGKTWDLAYRIKGKGVRRRSLGRYEDIGLEEAHDRAHDLTRAARKGVDLIAQELEAREAKARSMTVGKLTELYLERRIVGRLRSAPNVTRILRNVLEPLTSMHAADVRRRDLAPLLEAIAARGHDRLAGKTKVLIGGLFKWAESQDIVGADPTRGLPAYDQGTPRDRVLDADEIRLLWPWLMKLPSVVADALRVQLLTGARIGEIAGMLANEVDRSKWLWALSSARSKNKKSRLTPLVGLARTIIEVRIEAVGDGLLFPSERGGALTAAAVGNALLVRRNRLPIAVFKTHDLRRTAASEMDAIGISRDVIGEIIGHASEDGKSSRTLFRHYLKNILIKRKTHALEAWDARLRSIISGDVVDDKIVHVSHR